MLRVRAWGIGAALVMVGISHAAVNDKTLSDESDGTNWASYGRTFSENHYSPLKEIDSRNVSGLKLAWYHDLDTSQRTDSQPLAADGVVYVATGLSVVRALDAKSGRLLWRYDPAVGEVAGRKLRPSWGIRGLALWEGKVYVGTQDGRLISLDAKTGRVIWNVQTLDPNDETSITGAPRVFDGKVLIGFAGAERKGTRGAVNCFDARTGKRLWQFFTVPGDPAKGFENPILEMAAKTWSGEWWKYGGGGTVWNAIAYDPELRRVYIGTGNGGPWNWKIRNPDGGDALFLASIVALNPDTGEYIWHYQENPNEAWDYNSTMDIELATLTIKGEPRKVLMHAPKNGFFYVLDRMTGKPISAEKLGRVDWAERIDIETGRPVEVAGSRYENGPVMLWPGTYGIHNWQPMSFSPRDGLVFIPSIHMANYYDSTGIDPKSWQATPDAWVTGLGNSDLALPVDEFKSALLAWDPVAQKERWKVPTAGTLGGGTMATAGGLVFQGQIDGTFRAFESESGRELWKFNAGSAVTGAPISYSVRGKQYVTVLAGPPGGTIAYPDKNKEFGWRYNDPRRVLTFALTGKAKLPAARAPEPLPIASGGDPPDPQLVEQGAGLYGGQCASCHGTNVVTGGAGPELRASAVPLSREAFAHVVREGVFLHSGMPKFSELSATEVESIRSYIRSRANP